MKQEGELLFTIDKDGNVRIQILNNDSPGHGTMLTPFETVLSDGDKKKVNSHRHDHTHGHTHQHQGGTH